MLSKISMRNLAVGSVILTVAFLSACGVNKVTVGTKDEVQYKGTATKQEAEALGAALKQQEYFQDHGATVVLSKGSEGTILSFVVKDGVWNDEKMVTGFGILAHALAPTVGGLPITL